MARRASSLAVTPQQVLQGGLLPAVRAGRELAVALALSTVADALDVRVAQGRDPRVGELQQGVEGGCPGQRLALGVAHLPPAQRGLEPQQRLVVAGCGGGADRPRLAEVRVAAG